jgi:hypothetical protein
MSTKTQNWVSSHPLNINFRGNTAFTSQTLDETGQDKEDLFDVHQVLGFQARPVLGLVLRQLGESSLQLQ